MADPLRPNSPSARPPRHPLPCKTAARLSSASTFSTSSAADFHHRNKWPSQPTPCRGRQDLLRKPKLPYLRFLHSDNISVELSLLPFLPSAACLYKMAVLKCNLIVPFLMVLSTQYFSLSQAEYNVLNFGAKLNGFYDSATPLLKAWSKACSSRKPAVMYIPKGTYYVSRALFSGPCNNAAIRVLIKGTIVGPSKYDSSLKWLHFKNVNGVGIFGGVLDGRGRSLWNCKTRGGRNCPTGSISLTVASSKNVLISGLTSINSKLVHISIQSSSGVTVRNTKIIAPGNSPNTDGVHIMTSNAIVITGSTIQTGDDCVSIKPGVSNVWIENVKCGPGHGISIGSLGDDTYEAGVQNIVVKSVVFTGTQNGVRIKTWGKPSTGFVKGVSFQNIIMKNVQNPINIDQNYCPGYKNCPNQSSGIKITGVSFNNIQGSSATKVAMKLDCSRKNPCTGLQLRNIRLSYGKTKAQSFCRNARGRAYGFVIPQSCLK